MIAIVVYLTALIIAPQLWVDGIKGFPVDAIVYPFWIVVLIVTGRAGALFKLELIDWALLAAIGWGLLSIVLNPSYGKTSFFLIEYARFLVLFRLTVATLPTLGHVRRVVYVVLFFVLIMTVECIQHKLNPEGLGWAGQSLGWVDPSVIAAGGTGRTRWVAIFDGPGVFSVLFTIGLPIVLVMTGPPFGWFVRLIGISLLGPVLLATYYTGSRGGLLAALAIIGLYFLIRLRVSMTKIALVCGALLALYSVAPAHLTSIRDENRSAQHRVEMWARGVEMVQSNPLFGIGKGNYKAYTGRLIAHSSPIEIMGETGVPGLFFWVMLVYLAMKAQLMLRAGPYQEHDKAIALALWLIIVGYVVSAMFVTLEYETFYFLLGICAAVAKNLKPPLTVTKSDVFICASISIGWIMAVKLFSMSYF